LARIAVLAALLVMAVPAAAQGSVAAAPPCSKSAARDAIAASFGAQEAIRRTGNVEPGQDVFEVYGVSRVRCRDLTGDGKREMGVLLRCCTVSSYSPFLIFRPAGSGWEYRYAKSRMTIFKVSARGRSFVLKEPDYAATDPNCCPSDFRYYRIRYRRGEFRTTRIRG
jgi:hypothetical protein